MGNGRDGRTRVLALNSSPRKEKGVTDLVLRRFLKGAERAGAEVELVYLADRKIQDCRGCFHCWFVTPGKCRLPDDMGELLERMRGTDVIIYATPLYTCSMNGIMKRFLDRMLPTVEPYQELDREGVCRHPRRGEKKPIMVLISVAGFPGLRNFDPLVMTMERLAEVGGLELAAKILFPASPALMSDPCPAERQLEAVERAGKELVEGGISPTTLEEVHEPYVEPEVYVEEMNRLFKDLCGRVEG